MKIMTKYNSVLFFAVGIFIGFFMFFLFIYADSSKSEINFENSRTKEISKVVSPYIPKTINLCGEDVPLENNIIKEALDYELIINMYRHSSTILYIKRANRYFPAIEKFLSENNLPADLKYLCVAESGLANVVSNSGAVGFWQIMETTGKEYGLIINNNIDERYNFYLSMKVAAEYLKKSYNKFNNWVLAMASYNMGMTGLENILSEQNNNNFWDLKLNDETARYIFRILALKIIMETPKLYGYEISENELYKPLQTNEFMVDTSINDLVKFAFDNRINYKILKYYNPWIRSKQLKNETQKVFYISLPNTKI